MRLLSIFAILLSGLAADILAADRPNVLLIMVDDLRDYGGAFTRDVVKTPNLDRLRARGTTFERAYVQYPVCNPSRSSMMTGLRAEQTGIVGNNISLREKMPDIITMPQLCKEAGWQTHAFGNLYHLGGGNNLQAKQAWMDAGKSWHTAEAFEATKLGKKMLEGRNVTDGALNWCHWSAAAGTDEDQPDGQIAAATVAKINELGDTPWFIGCGFMKPHDPFVAPKRYFDLYPPDSLKLWRDPADITSVRQEAVGFGDYGTAFAKFTDTVADVCGLKIPHQVAGVSLRPVLKAPETSVKNAAFTLVTRGPKLYGQSVRTSRWRFTHWSDDQTELYDHLRDPEELHNVDSDNPEVVKELLMQLQTIGKPQSPLF